MCSSVKEAAFSCARSSSMGTESADVSTVFPSTARMAALSGEALFPPRLLLRVKRRYRLVPEMTRDDPR